VRRQQPGEHLRSLIEDVARPGRVGRVEHRAAERHHAEDDEHHRDRPLAAHEQEAVEPLVQEGRGRRARLLGRAVLVGPLALRRDDRCDQHGRDEKGEAVREHHAAQPEVAEQQPPEREPGEAADAVVERVEGIGGDELLLGHERRQQRALGGVGERGDGRLQRGGEVDEAEPAAVRHE
jgi:hypothetical protein